MEAGKNRKILCNIVPVVFQVVDNLLIKIHSSSSYQGES